MPVLAGDEGRARVGVDRQHLGMALGRLGGRVGVQRAEAEAELLLARQRQRLIAKEQHLVLQQRVVQLLELLVAEGPREIETGNLGTDPRGRRNDGDGLEWHVARLRWLPAINRLSRLM